MQNHVDFRFSKQSQKDLEASYIAVQEAQLQQRNSASAIPYVLGSTIGYHSNSWASCQFGYACDRL